MTQQKMVVIHLKMSVDCDREEALRREQVCLAALAMLLGKDPAEAQSDIPEPYRDVQGVGWLLFASVPDTWADAMRSQPGLSAWSIVGG